jgi:hypothetical protein
MCDDPNQNRFPGKTFSAEATSEQVRRPLCVIGGSALGTHAAALDASLERVFDVATAWKATALIDEVRFSFRYLETDKICSTG